MTTIAILGSGGVARTLTAGLRPHHQVTVGSRAPLGPAASGWPAGVRVGTHADAVRAAEIVVNATPGPTSVALLGDLAHDLSGKVLVDVANATVSDSDGFAVALRYPESSLAEEIQRALPTTRVVKTLNTMHASVMTDPARRSHPPTAFLSGDDPDARRLVRGLLSEMGWRPEWIAELGGIATARIPEAFILMIGDLVRAGGPAPLGLAIAC